MFENSKYLNNDSWKFFKNSTPYPFMFIDNFVNGGKTSTMKDRITAYKVLLNRAIETAQQTAEDTTFTGYPPQYVASLNSGEEVFHILQIPN